MAWSISNTFKNKRLAKTDLSTCMLLLEVTDTQAKTAIVDTGAGILLFLNSGECDHTDSLRELLFALRDNLPGDASDFATRRLMFANPAFDMVPDDWFIEDERDNYLVLHQKEPSPFPTNINRIDAEGLSFIAAVPMFVKTALDAFNTTFDLYHSGAVMLLKYFDAQQKKRTVHPKVYAAFFKDGVEILVTAEGKMMYYNQWISQEAMELLYFILNATASLGLPANFALKCCGNISPKSTFAATLKKARPQVSLSIGCHPATSALMKSCKGLNPVHYDNLIFLALCAS